MRELIVKWQAGTTAMHSSPGQVSALLVELEKGDPAAATRLLPIVYSELRRLAAYYMRGERRGQTIQPTELVHEAFLRLVGQERLNWQGRNHLLAMAATCMRRILVDRARRKIAERHGGGGEKIAFDEAMLLSPPRSSQLVALDDALNELSKFSPRQSRVVELRFFGGLEVDEIAKLEGVSPSTVKNDWRVARVWLHRQIGEDGK